MIMKGKTTGDIMGGETTIDPWSDFSLVVNALCGGKKNLFYEKKNLQDLSISQFA